MCFRLLMPVMAWCNGAGDVSSFAVAMPLQPTWGPSPLTLCSSLIDMEGCMGSVVSSRASRHLPSRRTCALCAMREPVTETVALPGLEVGPQPCATWGGSYIATPASVCAPAAKTTRRPSMQALRSRRSIPLTLAGHSATIYTFTGCAQWMEVQEC